MKHTIESVNINELYLKHTDHGIFVYEEHALKIMHPSYMYETSIEEEQDEIIIKINKHKIVLTEKLLTLDVTTGEKYETDFFKIGINSELFKYHNPIPFATISNINFRSEKDLKKYFATIDAYNNLFESRHFDIDLIILYAFQIKKEAEKFYDEKLEEDEFWNGYRYDSYLKSIITDIKNKYVDIKYIDIDLIRKYYCVILLEEPFNLELYEKAFEIIKSKAY